MEKENGETSERQKVVHTRQHDDNIASSSSACIGDDDNRQHNTTIMKKKTEIRRTEQRATKFEVCLVWVVSPLFVVCWLFISSQIKKINKKNKKIRN